MNSATAMVHEKPPTINEAIDALTGVRTGASGNKVFVYGTPNWFKPTAISWLLITPYGKLRPKLIALMRDGTKLFRDGDSSEFLIEMPEAYATIYDIESYVLSEADLDRLKTRIDMTRPW